MPSFSVYILRKHWFAYIIYVYVNLKSIMQFKTEEEVGREGGDSYSSHTCQIFCFAIHGRSLLIPTESMASLCKPKQTHLCPPGSERLSCLKFRYSWAHPILAIMKRVTYSSFSSSPVSRKHDQCLSLLALPNFSQHLLPTGFMRCKVRKAITFPIQSQYTIDWQVIQQRALKSGASPTFNQTVL